jgi:hypothetical protein
MKNTSIKNILILALSLFAIMLIATLIVIGFNFFIGFSTDVQNDDVATSIAAVAFAIAVLIRYLYDK